MLMYKKTNKIIFHFKFLYSLKMLPYSVPLQNFSAEFIFSSTVMLIKKSINLLFLIFVILNKLIYEN